MRTEVKQFKEVPRTKVQLLIPKSLHMRIQELALQDSKVSGSKVGIYDKFLEAILYGVEHLEKLARETAEI